MTDVTRKVDAQELADLLTASTIATVAWNDAGRPAAIPVAFRFVDGEYHIGWPSGAVPVDTVVSLLVDAGAGYFDLRGVRVRGRIRPVDHLDSDGLKWATVEPARVTAWHYGTMRQR